VLRAGLRRLGWDQHVERLAARQVDLVGQPLLLGRPEIARHRDGQDLRRCGAHHQVELAGVLAHLEAQGLARAGDLAIARLARGVDRHEARAPVGAPLLVDVAGQLGGRLVGGALQRADVPAELLGRHLHRRSPPAVLIGDRLEQDAPVAQDLVPAPRRVLLVEIGGLAAEDLEVPRDAPLDHPGPFVGERRGGVGVEAGKRQPRILVLLVRGPGVVPELGDEHGPVFGRLRQVLEHEPRVVVAPAVGGEEHADAAAAGRRQRLVDAGVGLREVGVGLPVVALHRAAGLPLAAVDELVRVDVAGALAAPAEAPLAVPAHPAPLGGLDRDLVLDAVAPVLALAAHDADAKGEPLGVEVVDLLRQLEHAAHALVEPLPVPLAPRRHLLLVHAVAKVRRLLRPPPVLLGPPPRVQLRAQQDPAREVVGDLLLRQGSLVQPDHGQVAVEGRLAGRGAAEHHPVALADDHLPRPGRDLPAVEVPRLRGRRAVHDDVAPLA